MKSFMNIAVSDYVDCPYCSRRFNEKAAERHINFCKEQQKRLTSKREPSQQEKARAAAKTVSAV
ncbi:hypothetical protein DPMN_069051 [Dreissena polymorpha]|uniref:C2HC/C3H-type domain-containing protein n=1 Tax=Dreissena polymorpha TaxID=45954 RepID=A0A9D3Z3D7_DREPO|nr:hypothetical protein DPMN_069051 [Dreissena polymorpha]